MPTPHPAAIARLRCNDAPSGPLDAPAADAITIAIDRVAELGSAAWGVDVDTGTIVLAEHLLASDYAVVVKYLRRATAVLADHGWHIAALLIPHQADHLGRRRYLRAVTPYDRHELTRVILSADLHGGEECG